MAADHDVANAQHLDRVLDGGRFAAAGAVRRHDVAGVAEQKQVAGLGLRDQIRMHARIGAGDEQGDRLLLLGGELLEESRDSWRILRGEND